MSEVTDPDERPTAGRCWKCRHCQRQRVEATVTAPARRRGRDSPWRCIRRRRRRFEVRIASGRRGYHVRLGLFGTLAEAQAARDRAEALRRAA